MIKAAKFNTKSIRTFYKLQCRKNEIAQSFINGKIEVDLVGQYGQRRAAAASVTEMLTQEGEGGTHPCL